jgi:RimJ/RimL family protein N-acetyltransferase
MQRTAVAPLSTARFPHGMANAWITRRWYYTPKSHRAYSVRPISPGDRRLLAEFVLGLSRAAPEREQPAVRAITSMLFDQALSASPHAALGFAALESTTAGDRIIGAAAYASTDEGAEFCIAVTNSYRDEQVGRTLLASLMRQARRSGIPRLTGVMQWANRPMQMLALAMGFVIEPVARDRNLRRLVLTLK